MDRKTFIQNSVTAVLSLSAFGKISWSNGHYVGDSPTTTDILGPFYRPNAPLRANINPAGYSGKLLHLLGTVLREDGKTPYGNCAVEIWQCDADRKYDNTSDEFRYRGRQITDMDGKYHFITAEPLPYPAGDSGQYWRPAHIHMVVTGDGQQDLITQLYFSGDPYLKTDAASRSSQSKGRILKIGKNSDGEDTLQFNVVMQKEFRLDDIALRKLSGIYTMDDKSLMEFYPQGDLLFLKWNGQIREALAYKGKNEFAAGADGKTTAKFVVLENGDVRVNVNFFRLAGSRGQLLQGIKSFRY